MIRAISGAAAAAVLSLAASAVLADELVDPTGVQPVNATPQTRPADPASAGLTLQPSPATLPNSAQAGAPRQAIYWTESGYLGWQSNASYGEADLHITRIGGEIEGVMPVHPRLIISAGLKVEDSVYDWNDFQKEVPGAKNPLGTALLLRFAPGFEFTPSPVWTVDGGIYVQTAGESNALFENATTYGALLIAKYKHSDTLSYGFGLIAHTDLEEGDNGVLPVLSFEWKINPQWSLSAENTELKLAYRQDDHTTYFLSSVYESRQFRLEDSGPLRHGTLQDTDIPIRLGLQYSPNAQLSFTGEVGVIAYEHIVIDDRNDDRVSKNDVGPAIFIGGRIEYHF